MHIYDRNGYKHHSAEDGNLIFGVSFLCAIVFILAGLSILAQHFGY